MLWEGRLDLTELVSKAREQLNGCKRSENQRNGELLAILEQTRKGLDKWRRQQDDTLTSRQDTLSIAAINNPRNLDPPSPNLLLQLEYYYAQIYIFSFATTGLVRVSADGMEGLDVRHEGLTRFVSEAIMASRELLQILTGVFTKSGVLRLLAVRVWLHAVCAALFLLKTTLANTPLPPPSNDDVRLLNRTVQAFRDHAPDDLHMANRYATFLEAVIEASVPAAAFTPAATSSPTLEIGRASTTNQAGIMQPTWQESQNLDFVNVTGD